MSKSSRSAKPRRSPIIITFVWLSGLVSLGLLYAAANAVVSDFGSFRSCSSNTSGLSVSNCGKTSLNPGDMILMVLFVLAAVLAISLMTAAWQMTWRSKS